MQGLPVHSPYILQQIWTTNTCVCSPLLRMQSLMKNANFGEQTVHVGTNSGPSSQRELPSHYHSSSSHIFCFTLRQYPLWCSILYALQLCKPWPWSTDLMTFRDGPGPCGTSLQDSIAEVTNLLSRGRKRWKQESVWCTFEQSSKFVYVLQVCSGEAAKSA